MEGKEFRFGIANSALFATVTTDASRGAVNSWHDSFTPVGGWCLREHHAGRSDFRRRGLGLVRRADLRDPSVFIAGLMVGRTPEYMAS